MHFFLFCHYQNHEFPTPVFSLVAGRTRPDIRTVPQDQLDNSKFIFKSRKGIWEIPPPSKMSVRITAQRRADNNLSDRATPIHQPMSSTYLTQLAEAEVPSLFQEIASIRAKTGTYVARPGQVHNVTPDHTLRTQHNMPSTYLSDVLQHHISSLNDRENQGFGDGLQTLRTQHDTPSINLSDVLQYHLSSRTGRENQRLDDGLLTSHNAGGHDILSPSIYGHYGWVLDPDTQMPLHWILDPYTRTPRFQYLLPSWHNGSPKGSLQYEDTSSWDIGDGISENSSQLGTNVLNYAPKTSGVQPSIGSATLNMPLDDIQNSGSDFNLGYEWLPPGDVARTFISHCCSLRAFQPQKKSSLHHV